MVAKKSKSKSKLKAITKDNVDIFGNVVEPVVEEVEEKTDSLGLFDIIKDITQHNSTAIESYYNSFGKLPGAYNQFMINRFLANFIDTLSIADFLNCNPGLSDYHHWLVVKSVIPKGTRFTKWYREVECEYPLELLANYFHCTQNEIKKNLSAFKQEDLRRIIEELQKSEQQV